MKKILLIKLLILLIAPSLAHANELSRTDKLRVLYSNQFSFDRHGIPVITIGIADGLSSVVIESKQAVRVLPDGEDGSEITAGNSWQITLDKSTPALIEHYIVLASYPVDELTKLREEMAKWKARKIHCKMIEIGTIFGTKGEVFDNRTYILGDGPYPSNDQALRIAEKYVHQFGLSKVATIPKLKKRPGGQLTATDPSKSTKIKVHDAIWFSPSGNTHLSVRIGNEKSNTYWGQIYVTLGQDGKITVVNAVSANKLLAGLVPAEIFPTAPQAALLAQAVAARGDLLAKIGTRHLVDPYLICAKQHCQVYKGAGHEHPNTTKAIHDTKGLVLVRKNGRLINTVYSACCGGHTEDNNNVWPSEPDPNLRGLLDSSQNNGPFANGINEKNLQLWLDTRPSTWCGQSGYNQEKYRWTIHLSKEQIDNLLASLTIGKIKEIKVLDRGRSGRVKLIEIKGNKGNKTVRGELQIRNLFGGLKSSMFLLSIDGMQNGYPTGFTFKGGGWGHGVGMCQTGAIGMANAKKDFKTILNHYYRDSVIKSLY